MGRWTIVQIFDGVDVGGLVVGYGYSGVAEENWGGKIFGDYVFLKFLRVVLKNQFLGILKWYYIV